jgi:nucleoside-diphosphate-sugar epimerase
LVIGSEGNVGAPLARYLASAGYQVMEADIRPGWRENYLMADMTHPLDLLPAFDWGPDVVFLLAASVGRMTCEQAASLSITTNLAGVNNVLQLCKRVGAMCVYFSTSEVYGPHCDWMDDSTTPPRPNNRYGLSKWLGENLVEYEVRTGGLRAVTLRPCMLYDEAEDIGEHRSAMIRFASNLARGRPIEVHRGSARGWLHVSDAVRAVEAAGRLDHYATINLGHPDLVPIADLAEMIRAELQADPALIRTIELPGQMTLIKRPTLKLQKTLLSFEPWVDLAEGVRRVCAQQMRLVAVERRLASGSAGTLADPTTRLAPAPHLDAQQVSATGQP